MSAPLDSNTPKSPLQEITQPFIDLVHAPRALWGINVGYLIEGFCYFGVLQYLAMYFMQYAGLDDVWSQRSKMVLTAGITISMFFFGGRADKWGPRFALLGAFVLMIFGRSLLAYGPNLGGSGFASPVYLLAVGGILLVVLGYGVYQPAAYAGVRKFTTPATASMGYAMLYALMNLGGWLNSFMSPIRGRYEIKGAYWFYVGITAFSLIVTWLILTRRTVQKAIADAKTATDVTKAAKSEAAAAAGAVPAGAAAVSVPDRIPRHLWVVAALTWIGAVYLAYYEWGALRVPQMRFLKIMLLVMATAIVLSPLVLAIMPSAARTRFRLWAAAHPFANAKFFFFIFSLIPVQTLFAYNFGTMQAYVDRAYSAPAVLEEAGLPVPTTQSAEAGKEPPRIKYADLPVETQVRLTPGQRWTIWTGEHFEAATNLNSLLIFILVPIITALTLRQHVYTMMIVGTFVMAAPSFLLAMGTNYLTLGVFIVTLTVGEAIWQPRFLQYAAQIAPEGRTGAYMGVAQLPWFLTKVIVPVYEGVFLKKYCPQQGAIDTQTMWLIFGCIAIVSPILLILARSWAGKNMKTQAD